MLRGGVRCNPGTIHAGGTRDRGRGAYGCGGGAHGGVVAVQVKEPETETCTEYRLPGQNAPGFEDLYMTVDRNRGTAEITGSYMLDDRLDLIHETSMQSKTCIVQGRYFDDTRPRSGIVSTVEWRRQTDGSCVRGDEGEQFRIEAIRLEFRNDVLNIKSSAVITGPGEEGVWYRM